MANAPGEKANEVKVYCKTCDADFSIKSGLHFKGKCEPGPNDRIKCPYCPKNLKVRSMSRHIFETCDESEYNPGSAKYCDKRRPPLVLHFNGGMAGTPNLQPGRMIPEDSYEAFIQRELAAILDPQGLPRITHLCNLAGLLNVKLEPGNHDPDYIEDEVVKYFHRLKNLGKDLAGLLGTGVINLQRFRCKDCKSDFGEFLYSNCGHIVCLKCFELSDKLKCPIEQFHSFAVFRLAKSIGGSVFLPMCKKRNSLASTQSATTAVGPNMVYVKVDEGARLVWTVDDWAEENKKLASLSTETLQAFVQKYRDNVDFTSMKMLVEAAKELNVECKNGAADLMDALNKKQEPQCVGCLKSRAKFAAIRCIHLLCEECVKVGADGKPTCPRCGAPIRERCLVAAED